MRTYITDNVVDQNQVAVIGAQIYVLAEGEIATLEDVDGNPLDNPLVSGEDGFFSGYSTSIGTHELQFFWGNKLRRIKALSQYGVLPDRADLIGKYVVGNADGELIPSDGTGADAGLRTDLAQDTGGSLVGLDDGAGGADYTSVQGFVTYLLTSFASLLGFTQSGVGAVERPLEEKLREVHFSVKDYGAVGDDATDDTTAIVKALTAAKTSGGKVVFPAGIYRHTGIAISDLRFVRIEGIANCSFSTAGAKGVRLVNTSDTSDHIALTNPHTVSIDGIQFENLGTPTAGAVINIVATNGGSANVDISNIRIENHFNGVIIDGCSNCSFTDSQVREGLGTLGVHVIGTSKRIDQVRLTDLIIDTTVTGGSTTYDGVRLGTDTHTIFIDRVSSLKCFRGFYLGGAIPPEFIYMSQAEAENSNNHGFLIDGADHLRMDGVYATDNNESGIYFSGNFDNTARLYAPGCRVNAKNGILIDGSGGIEIISPRIGGNSVSGTNTFHGISISAGVGDVSIIGGRVGGDLNLQGTGNQRNGILVNTGASDNYRILGVDVRGNQNAGIVDNGTGTNKLVLTNLGADDEGYFRGTVTVTTGNTTANIAHGLGAEPTHVFITPTSDPGAGRWWAAKSATNVIPTLSAAAGSDVTFDVEAWA